MKLNNKIIAALFGALSITATAAVASADHDRDRDRYDDRYYDADRYYDMTRVLDTKRLRNTRGQVEFDVEPGLRRDGLMLVTNGTVGIRKIEFHYSDGRVVTLKGRKLERLPQESGTITIQTGRPPGLRHVRVWYAQETDRYSRYDRDATLKLISFGDGYTDEEDLWENQRDQGRYPDRDGRRERPRRVYR
jgi:hypothetical protein